MLCLRLKSAQWFRQLLTEAHMAHSSLTNVEKKSLKRAAHEFTDSDSLAIRKALDRATTRGSEWSCLCSEKGSDQWRQWRRKFLPHSSTRTSPHPRKPTRTEKLLETRENCGAAKGVLNRCLRNLMEKIHVFAFFFFGGQSSSHNLVEFLY